MQRLARYDRHLHRFVLKVEYGDDVMFDVKRIEGRRFHPGVKYWSVPGSLRAWKKLEALGFTMMAYGEGKSFVEWVEKDCPVDPGILGNDGLFPYQKLGVSRLLCRDKMVLADDPGLGKTIQAIEWGMRRTHGKLVVAPKIVLSQWYDTIHERYKYHGEQLADVVIRQPTVTEKQWNLVNYEYLPKVQNLPKKFDLIVDEAHLCTNTKAARTKSILTLSNASTRTLLLTGTPPSKPAKLWPFFLATGERTAKEFFPFALRYAGAERNDFGWDFSGATHLDELRDEVKHFMLRRTKEEVLSQLPPLLTTTLTVDTKTGTVGERNAILKQDDEILDLMSRGHSLTSGLGLGAVQTLRMLASKQKVSATVDYVTSLGPTKVVIFCQFRETMELLYTALVDEDMVQVSLIHGDVSDTQRLDTLDWFDSPCLIEDGEFLKVLIVQSSIAGLALDGLQAAGVGIIHDIPWTHDEYKQIINRLHRQGTEHSSVNIVTMLSTSVVEKRMEQAIRDGKELHEVMYG